MRRIHNDQQRMNLIRDLSSLELPFRIEIFSGERSMSQNALSHVWYGELGKQDKSRSNRGWRQFCKLHFGVPILRVSSEKFRDAWDNLIKNRLTYEEKLALMDWWPVTSLMDHKQMAEYLTEMQMHFAERGIVLTGLDRGESDYPEARRA